ncbi:MAG: hypothetical protein WCI27_03715, partial [Candidatus Omnitrophota bacterium]
WKDLYEEKVIFLDEFPIYSTSPSALSFEATYMTRVSVLSPDGPYQWAKGSYAALTKQKTIKMPSLILARSCACHLINVDGRWLSNN